MEKKDFKKVCLLIGFLAAVMIPWAGRASAGLVEEMAALDREFIPVLALTNQPEKPEVLVKKAFGRLTQAWEKFLLNLSPVQKEDPILQPAIQEAEKHIEEAGKMLALGRRAEAHEALEGIRSGLAKARKLMGMDYLPDRLTAFHDPMELFYLRVTGSLTSEEFTRLKKDLEQLSALWAEVEKHPLDRDLFGFNPEKTKLYSELVTRERDILTQMATLLTPDKKEDLVKTAATMKTVFARIYLLFGDFRDLN